MNLTYKEYKNKYSYATKKYPDTCSLPFNTENFIGSMTKTKQIKKKNKWVDTEQYTKSITTEIYMNIIDAIPFFRNMGSETVYEGYTIMGYIPYKIISTSPDKKERYVYDFSF